MNPTNALRLLDTVQTLTVIASAGAVSIAVLEAADLDLAQPFTAGGFLTMAAALALGYAAAGIVDRLLARLVRDRRKRIQDALAEEMWPDCTPEEFVAVAASIQMFLRDLRDGLPCAVAMARPGGRMPVTADEWIAYATSDERYASLSSAAKTGPKSASA
ncbi:hypothetical protein [Streptomyces sp. 030-HV]|uniref:hypothetical protein n=1 Tax=Streptomyces sp. 030-HV TaxID=2789262 RepID=UPI00397ED465